MYRYLYVLGDITSILSGYGPLTLISASDCLVPFGGTEQDAIENDAGLWRPGVFAREIKD